MITIKIPRKENICAIFFNGLRLMRDEYKITRKNIVKVPNANIKKDEVIVHTINKKGYITYYRKGLEIDWGNWENYDEKI